MKPLYTQYLSNGEVRITAFPFISEDWPKACRKPRVEILQDGKAWLYHELDGVFAWSIMPTLDDALRAMVTSE